MVVERKRIGILFGYWEGWIGGTYYFINLVWALKKLDQEKMPHIVVFADSQESFNLIRDTGYPYLSFESNQVTQTRVKRIINFAYRQLTGRSLFRIVIDFRKIPVLFGYYDQLYRFKCDRCIYWIPDFQEKYYPDLVGDAETKKRNKIQQVLARKKVDIVFSSNSALSDYIKFFPHNHTKNTVVRFATNIEAFDLEQYQMVLHKYRISQPYYIVCNQFWRHKNHLVIIKAVEYLKSKGIEVVILFTGKEEQGASSYAADLKEYVDKYQLSRNIRFMGFLQREEQLMLMKGSMAVIQPSLFEGWSTVIEDAKAMNKSVLATNLAVHKEQLGDCCFYFGPNDYESLAQALISHDKPKTFNDNYSHSISRFAEEFSALLDKI